MLAALAIFVDKGFERLSRQRLRTTPLATEWVQRSPRRRAGPDERASLRETLRQKIVGTSSSTVGAKETRIPAFVGALLRNQTHRLCSASRQRHRSHAQASTDLPSGVTVFTPWRAGGSCRTRDRPRVGVGPSRLSGRVDARTGLVPTGTTDCRHRGHPVPVWRADVRSSRTRHRTNVRPGLRHALGRAPAAASRAVTALDGAVRCVPHPCEAWFE